MDESRSELSSRLDRIEDPNGGMLQEDLPWSDVVACVGLLMLTTVLLLWWAR